MNSTSIFVCQNCGYESVKWDGKCPNCQEWGTFEEKVVTTSSKKKNVNIDKPTSLESINIESKLRTMTQISEFDRVIGNGFVFGQVILISGTPGIGKSTILLQIANNINKKVLYASGEESIDQIALRAKRLGVKNSQIDLLSSNNIDNILESCSHDLLIVDSIQAVATNDLKSQTGSISQIKECANKIVGFAKSRQIPAIIVGHITKDGNIAGPKLLEHIVDTVLVLEGDTSHLFRLLKVTKNRFGDASEVGIFEMQSTGLLSVENPSSFFIERSRPNSFVGSSIAVILEGTRPMLIEVQALTSKSSFGYPRRAVSGFSLNRLNLLCAVIQKHLKIDLSNQDVYINIAAGLTVKEPGVDLAVCAAILSSILNKHIGNDTAFCGEVGLSGEVRRITIEEKREKLAKSLGINNIYSSSNINSLLDLKNIFK